MSNDGVQKGVIFMFVLGEDEVVEVMKYLGLKEVQKLGVVMLVLCNVSFEEINEVLEVFVVEIGQVFLLGLDLDEYICSVLIKVLGDDKVIFLFNCILGGCDVFGIESFKWMDVQLVVELICNEYLQIIVIILVYLECDYVCGIINNFMECLCNDVIFCIVILDGVQLVVLCEFNDVLIKLLIGNESFKK